MSHKSVLLQTIHDKARLRRLSLRTEVVYRRWIIRFIRHHGPRHPRDLGDPEVAAFLTHLASERHVAASTQTQALCAVAVPLLDGPGPAVGSFGRDAMGSVEDSAPGRPDGSGGARGLGAGEGILLAGRHAALRRRAQADECVTLRVKALDLTRCEIRVRTTQPVGPTPSGAPA